MCLGLGLARRAAAIHIAPRCKFHSHAKLATQEQPSSRHRADPLQGLALPQPATEQTELAPKSRGACVACPSCRPKRHENPTQQSRALRGSAMELTVADPFRRAPVPCSGNTPAGLVDSERPPASGTTMHQKLRSVGRPRTPRPDQKFNSTGAERTCRSTGAKRTCRSTGAERTCCKENL